MILQPSALDNMLQDRVSDLEFPRPQLLVVSHPNLLMMGSDMDLGLLAPFLLVIQHRSMVSFFSRTIPSTLIIGIRY